MEIGTVAGRIGLTIALSLVAQASAFGQLTYFIEGDAFFRFELTDEVIGQFDKKEAIVLDYKRGPNGSPFGVEGHQDCELTGIDDGFRRHLRLAVKAMTKGKREYRVFKDESGKVVSEEALPLGDAFLVAGTSPLEWHGVGLRYNETWMDKTWSYQPHFRDEKLILTDWAGAAKVDGLPVQFTGRRGRPVASCKDITLLITQEPDVDELAKISTTYLLYDIRSSGLKEFEAFEGKWKEIKTEENDQ